MGESVSDSFRFGDSYRMSELFVPEDLVLTQDQPAFFLTGQNSSKGDLETNAGTQNRLLDVQMVFGYSSILLSNRNQTSHSLVLSLSLETRGGATQFHQKNIFSSKLFTSSPREGTCFSRELSQLNDES